MRVLIIGAAGRVGSAALAACLAKGHVVSVFVWNPAKLPQELRNHPRLRVIKGDATSHASLVDALGDQDAVIQAAVYGSSSPYGTSDSEKVIQCIIKAVQEVHHFRQMRGSMAPRIRLWVVSGQVLMDIPGGRGRIEGDIFPIHPEHYKNYAFLQQDARDVDWSLLCPGRIDRGEPIGPVMTTVDEVPLWPKPWLIGNLPVIGTILNLLYNFGQQHLTSQSVGGFLASNLGEAGIFRGKKVGILEDASGGHIQNEKSDS